MKIQEIKRIGQKIEPIIVFFLLFYFSGVVVPSGVRSVIKIASYGAVALLIICRGRLQRFTYVGTRDVALLLLLCVTVLSFFWSAAPNFTLDETKAVIRNTLLGVYLATYYTPKKQMKLFTWVVCLGAIISIALIVAVPGYGIKFGLNETFWKGLYAHKQYLGRIMTLGAMSCLLMMFDERNRHRLIALFGFLLTTLFVLLSGSKTSLVIILLSLFFMPFYKLMRQKYKLRTFLLSTGLLVIASVAVIIIGNLETIVVDILGKNMELSSRTPVWELAIGKGLERPLLGYGYAGFWTSDASQFIIDQTWAGSAGSGRFHAHNGFVDVFLQVGLVGLVLCMINVLAIIPRAITLIKATRGTESFWILQFILLTLLFNVTETRTLLAPNLFWTMTVSLSLSTIVYCERLKRMSTSKSDEQEKLQLNYQREI